MTARRRITDAQAEEIVRLREDKKYSLRRIASHLGLHTSAVQYVLLKAGVLPFNRTMDDPRRAGAFTPDDDARLLELARGGMATVAIARVMKRPRSSVRMRLMLLEARAEQAAA